MLRFIRSIKHALLTSGVFTNVFLLFICLFSKLHVISCTNLDSTMGSLLKTHKKKDISIILFSNVNFMYLLTEGEGQPGKYLARGHDVRTELLNMSVFQKAIHLGSQ